MNKLLIAAAGAALLAGSASAFAADANGAFFVNAGAGQAQYHVGRTDGLGVALDDKDTAGALRLGYAWNAADGVAFGVEGGYVDLGKLTVDAQYGTGTFEHAEVEAKGWLLGANGKFNFADKWYVSARAGWFRSTADASYRYNDPLVSEYGSGSAHGNGWYGGVGLGYDLTGNFSLGLNYDNYHGRASNQIGSIDGNIGTFMATAEVRF